MAIFHMNFKNISAGDGRSVVASASYRSGEVLYREADEKNYEYPRVVKPESFILLPENAPEWSSDRERLWNEVEAQENKANSRYAKEFNIALPIELSDDEQRELLTKYVQETFVDSGMVADVAIHRDHQENPHAHVMLTNRPFNADGSWGQKAKTEYIIDENGNKTRTEQGNIRQRKVWLVDWDKPGKVDEWRGQWAQAVNQYFELKKMPDRISEKTLKEQGIELPATKHVGVNNQAEERAEYNELVKEQRSNLSRQKNIGEKIVAERRLIALKEHMSFTEKGQIAKLGKELQTYIEIDQLRDKQRMIFNWKNSTFIKNAVGEDMTKSMQIIARQDNALEEANELVDKVVNRVIDKVYPELDKDKFTKSELRQLIVETNSENRIFSNDELPERMNDIRAFTVNREVLTFTKRPYTSANLLQNQKNTTIANMENVLQKQGKTWQGLDDSKGKLLQDFTGQDREDLVRSVRQYAGIKQMERVVEAQYKTVIERTFNEVDYKALELRDKERLYNLIMYYNPEQKTLKPAHVNVLVKNPPRMFSTNDHVQGLKVLAGQESIDNVKNQALRRVISHGGTVQLFIGEAANNGAIPQELLEQAKHESSNEWMKNERFNREQIGGDYRGIKYGESTPKQYTNRLFTSAMMNIIYNLSRNQKNEQQLEQDMKAKSRRQEHSYGRGM
ncbi:MobQ family relaxase [Weissella sp. MSCH1]|uniref:MobQ family relaxase n=1 Tax=Weissella sp. MSCH1 TaxID=3383343 RepID=UPI003896BFB2